jgi:hypothetical protein
VWADLCDVANHLGMEVRQEPLPDEARIQGGIARVADRHFLVVDSRLAQASKNEVLAELLRGCEIEDVYMPPYLREWLSGKGFADHR